MARFLTINATGRAVLQENAPAKYAQSGRGIVVTTNANLALTESVTGRILPAFLLPSIPIPTLRARDSTQIFWTDRTTSLVIADADLTGGTYGAKVNGRYRINLGNLRSTIPGVPVLKVTATQPVTFYNMNFFGWGMDASQQTGMIYGGTNSDMRFENTMFFSNKPPSGYNGAMPGHDIVSENGANLEAVNCESWGTRGTLVATFRNPSVSGLAGGGVRFSRFLKINVDGRRVDASGNWGGGLKVANYIQLQNCSNFPGNNSYIEDYIIRNDPVYGSHYEDAVSVYNSYCASGETLVFRRFLAENCLPYDPLFVSSGGTKAVFGKDASNNNLAYSGTGGLMGDQLGATGLTETTVAQGFKLFDGTILTTANYGAAIQAGHHNSLDTVTVVSAGVIRSAAPGGYSKLAWDAGGGLQSWNLTNSSSSLYHDNVIQNSTVGYYVFDKDSGSYRAGYTPIWTPTSTGLTTTNNTIRTLPASPAAGLAEVDAARALRIKSWTDAGTVIGCTDAASFTAIKISTDLP